MESKDETVSTSEAFRTMLLIKNCGRLFLLVGDVLMKFHKESQWFEAMPKNFPGNMLCLGFFRIQIMHTFPFMKSEHRCIMCVSH